MGAREEKPLLARIFVMYAVAATVNLISSFERSRWRAAVERERALQRERIELSQAIHDTTAQTAFMIGLGIDAAKQVCRRLETRSSPPGSMRPHGFPRPPSGS